MSISMLDLVAMFDALEVSGSHHDGSSFAAQQLSGFPSHYLGKDSAGKPAILVAVVAGPAKARPAPIVLEHLSVLHDVECQLLQPDGSASSSCFTVVRCLGSSKALQEYFLRAVAPVVMGLGQSPTQEQVIGTIRTLVELFRAMTMPPRKPIQGLWAELFVISKSENPSAMLRTWHSTPEDHYDFCEGLQRVEVKSASGGVRAHKFSLAQLRPPTGTVVIVASLFAERSAGGQNVFDLIRIIQSRVSNHHLIARMDQTAAETLGEDWRRAEDLCFDRELAAESLRFFEALDVPCVSGLIPAQVTDVRFRSDLTGVAEIDHSARIADGGLFQSAIARRPIRADSI